MRLSFSITIDAEGRRGRGSGHTGRPRTAVSRSRHGRDHIRRLATHRGAPLDLTRREFDLLLFLSEHPDHVHARQQVMAAVWGIDDGRGLRTVDVHVRRLRQKLGAAADVITTVRGVGYVVTSNGRVRVHRDQELRLAAGGCPNRTATPGDRFGLPFEPLQYREEFRSSLS